MTKSFTHTMSALAIASALMGAAYSSTAPVHAEPVNTINLTDIPDIDTLPVCHVEDCSDQVGQTGVWLSTTGTWYLERGEGYTRMIIDNTVLTLN